ncbi:MAG: HAD-IA family hydrolase [Planctomycetes bacterium]|nr:HAD-IA family hydrolase [Planctomycetota bacterium]
MADNEIEGILFDLGETLLNFGKVDTLGLFKVSGRLSWDYLQQRGQKVRGFRRYLWGNLLNLQVRIVLSSIFGNDFDSLEVLRWLGNKRGYQLSNEQWLEINDLWYEPLKRLADTEPDIKETLGNLSNAGIKLGIISNTFVNSHSLDKHLAEAGILEFFEHRIYSYQYSFRKPDKRIFLAGAEMIGVKAENIMYVGDRVDKDVKGSAKAGMTPVLKRAYTNEGKEPGDGVLVIDKISELPAMIGKFNS